MIHRLMVEYQPRPKENCHKPECLIVTPTRELAIQIYDEVPQRNTQNTQNKQHTQNTYFY
jgi:superfamily II DNA/RNA helicase